MCSGMRTVRPQAREPHYLGSSFRVVLHAKVLRDSRHVDRAARRLDRISRRAQLRRTPVGHLLLRHALWRLRLLLEREHLQQQLERRLLSLLAAQRVGEGVVPRG